MLPHDAPQSTFRMDIEGLRGIAILLVVAYHAGVPGFTGGFVGVDVFFVLSGYLITGLLVGEAERTGTIDLIRFYGRRAKRLLPASALVLMVTAVAGFVIFSPIEQRNLATTAIASAAYVGNAYFAVEATDYLAADAAMNPLLHMWSLAVEEQFYLVWPLVLLLVMGAFRRAEARRRRIALLVVMGLGIVVSLGLSVWLTEIRPAWAFFLPFTRAWEFALGGVAALVPTVPSRRSRVIGWAGLIAVACAGVLFTNATAFPGYAALLPVLGTVAVLRAGPSSGVGRLLCARPLREAGRLSYSWYLWHWPALVFTTSIVGPLALHERVAVMVFALALAEASYRLVENPVRHHPTFDRRPVSALALAAVLTVACLGTASAWRVASNHASAATSQAQYSRAWQSMPEVYEDGCHLDVWTVEPAPCSYGAIDSATTIVLVGDSHAAQWFPALDAIADARGWHLISLTKSSCPAVDVEPGLAALGGVYDQCQEWREHVFDVLERVQPTMTIFASYGAYDVTQAEWLSGLFRTFSVLSEVSDHVVHLRSTPIPGFDVLPCLAKATWRPWSRGADGCGFERSASMGESYPEVVRIAGEFSNVVASDLTHDICPEEWCIPERDGQLVFRDSDHLTTSFAEHMTSAVEEHLVAVLDRAPTSAPYP